MLQLQSLFGVFALLAIAWTLGENRGAVSLKQAAIGLAVTLLTAVVLMKLPFVAHGFSVINDAVGAISAASRAGTSFVFGYLGGGALPFDLKAPGADFILAFQALPIVLVMSVLTTLLFYWRVLPPVVRGMAWLLERTLGVGGAVGLSTAANIFLGMVEAPLFIRPYLAKLTRSELFLVMTRHGRHRRHRAGALRHAAGAADSRCRGTFCGCVGARRPRGDPDQPDHGARDQ
jgi:CNT family concentrative nucleoside transporter